MQIEDGLLTSNGDVTHGKFRSETRIDPNRRLIYREGYRVTFEKRICRLACRTSSNCTDENRVGCIAVLLPGRVAQLVWAPNPHQETMSVACVGRPDPDNLVQEQVNFLAVGRVGVVPGDGAANLIEQKSGHERSSITTKLLSRILVTRKCLCYDMGIGITFEEKIEVDTETVKEHGESRTRAASNLFFMGVLYYVHLLETQQTVPRSCDESLGLNAMFEQQSDLNQGN